MPTRKPIEDLKRQWSLDPVFDLEDASGFEEHKTELYLFRMETERQWARNEVTLLRAAITTYRNGHKILMEV